MTDLRWPDCRNVRDLGGVAGIRSGALIRSDTLCLLTDEGVAAVRSANASRIIDLRTRRERDSRPSPFAGDPTYVHRDLYPDPVPPMDPTLSPVEEYVHVLELGPTRFAAAVGAIADAPAGTVIAHCHGGSDRTGLVVALTLRSVGIARDSVVTDYNASGDVDAAVLEGALDHLDARYGGVTAYLTAGGMRPEQLSALRDRLESTPSTG